MKVLATTLLLALLAMTGCDKKADAEVAPAEETAPAAEAPAEAPAAEAPAAEEAPAAAE